MNNTALIVLVLVALAAMILVAAISGGLQSFFDAVSKWLHDLRYAHDSTSIKCVEENGKPGYCVVDGKSTPAEGTDKDTCLGENPRCVHVPCGHPGEVCCENVEKPNQNKMYINPQGKCEDAIPCSNANYALNMCFLKDALYMSDPVDNLCFGDGAQCLAEKDWCGEYNYKCCPNNHCKGEKDATDDNTMNCINGMCQQVGANCQTCPLYTPCLCSSDSHDSCYCIQDTGTAGNPKNFCYDLAFPDNGKCDKTKKTCSYYNFCDMGGCNVCH